MPEQLNWTVRKEITEEHNLTLKLTVNLYKTFWFTLWNWTWHLLLLATLSLTLVSPHRPSDESICKSPDIVQCGFVIACNFNQHIAVVVIHEWEKRTFCSCHGVKVVCMMMSLTWWNIRDCLPTESWYDLRLLWSSCYPQLRTPTPEMLRFVPVIWVRTAIPCSTIITVGVMQWSCPVSNSVTRMLSHIILKTG